MSETTTQESTIVLEMPGLTTEPELPVVTEVPVSQEEIECGPYLSDVQLTPEEQQMVDEFSSKIEVSDSNVILQYGSAAQKKIAEFSDSALEGVKTKDLGEVSGMLTGLITELSGFDIDQDEKKFLSFFKKKGNELEELKLRYNSAEKNVDRIVDNLETHQNTLQKDILMLDEMYKQNLVYFKELTMYIIAGKKRLEECRSTTLLEMRNKAEASGLEEDAQAANDYADLCDRFEKKLHDLALTRTVSMQMAPQIRLVQNSDTLMVEKIQSTVSNTIPLWKNQMVLALGLAHSQQAMQAQHAVNELTNELIKKNAETLHQGSVQIAEESERGIIDLETLQHSNNELITSLNEVMEIHENGRQKRFEAEQELARIEAELKAKLIEMSR